MDSFSPSDLKTILHSKRANIYYLEHCRLLVNGGRVEYVTDEGKRSLYWNIPIANTTSLLLGTGTSITQAAMRELAKAGVLVGFCGGGGTPLYSANEIDIEVTWMSPQSEYRPTEYLQHWVKIWFDDEARLSAAKKIQLQRLGFIEKHWQPSRYWQVHEIDIAKLNICKTTSPYRQQIAEAQDNNSLLVLEARLTKTLYKLMADITEYGEFRRAKRGQGTDIANQFLDHGNYLAYGLGATATWVLGLPHGLSVLHGKTRRGGLVFDVADLVKDALILPQAFISAVKGDEEQEFRQACLERLSRQGALDDMIDTVKEIALNKELAK